MQTILGNSNFHAYHMQHMKISFACKMFYLLYPPVDFSFTFFDIMLFNDCCYFFNICGFCLYIGHFIPGILSENMTFSKNISLKIIGKTWKENKRASPTVGL